MNLAPNRRGIIFVLLVLLSIAVAVGFVIVIVAALMTASSGDNNQPVADVSSCRVELVSARTVYNEPANPSSHVGGLEPGTYRIVAFSLENWVSVDWNNSGIQVSAEALQFLDWLQLEDGIDILFGDCSGVPRLGLRSD